ncbi:MAG: GNAT family N-acetyltransferase [Salinivirgaceae bacterium]|jgi:predicted GNAT family acetyltransferase|nr:GNAT family N-acetyltransferase [Salinivirgaceae bacterium]
MNKFELINNEAIKRFEVQVGEYTPFVTYQLKGDVMYLNFAKVPKELEGQGVGKKMVEQVLTYTEQAGYKVVPVCGFIAAIIKRNPRWHSLLR